MGARHLPDMPELKTPRKQGALSSCPTCPTFLSYRHPSATKNIFDGIESSDLFSLQIHIYLLEMSGMSGTPLNSSSISIS